MLPPAPAHLLISQAWETRKRSLISQEQLKPSVYYQHSSHTKSKTQQLLGRKQTLSQPKPGQKWMGLLLGVKHYCLAKAKLQIFIRFHFY